MPDDLRTGLVEAMARAQYVHVWEPADGTFDTATPEVQERWRVACGIALDAALGFLTDNAEAMKSSTSVSYTASDDEFEPGKLRMVAGPADMSVPELIAALSDSRDTGEKP